MSRLIGKLFVVVALSSGSLLAQWEAIDSSAIAKIREEGFKRSQVMEILSYLTDVNGPRLTGSTGHLKSTEWVRSKLKEWNLENPHLEAWGPWGKGWTLKKYSATVLMDQPWPLQSFPKAWSPGTNGTITAEVIYLEAKTDSALATYKGKLKNKIVMLSDPRSVEPYWTIRAIRESDSSLLRYANAEATPADAPSSFVNPPAPTEAQKIGLRLNWEKWKLIESEGALAVMTTAFNDAGNMQFVQAAGVPRDWDAPASEFKPAYRWDAPKILPQIYVGIEHYQRLLRVMQKGLHPKVEMKMDVEIIRADSSFNVIAEIPGTDLKDEVVMIGAHLDSWHSATGATDNATGVTTCMEAVRILQSLGLKPRRTIRIALWSGEEQGELGSNAYIRQHFAEIDSARGAIKHKPEAAKFSVYFNNDNGTGKVRGVFMEGMENVRPIFRRWLEPFRDLGASTLTLERTTSTDHEPFVHVGLPGFQFIQDRIEYFTKSWHSTQDLYERVLPEDLQQASVVMAAFAYNAAMRDGLFPRKIVKSAVSNGTH
jgi:hypothetical protein